MRSTATIFFVASISSASAPERYASGLPIRTTDVAGRAEVTVLRAAPAGRVRINGGTFTMGSTPLQMLAAAELCKREPLGNVEIPDESHPDGKISLHCRMLRFQSEGVAHAVTLSPYWIDRTEVRLADYARCVSAGVCNPPGFTPGDARFSNPEFPVVMVSWDDAREYCGFARGRLPSEAEWELAARGLEGRVFPWGNVYNPHLCNHGSIALDPTDATDGFALLAPVGAIPDGRTPLGLLDMAGNVAEWVADAVEPEPIEVIPLAYAPTPQINPRPTAGSRRVIRGGSYAQGPEAQRATARIATYPARRLPTIGFRCAAND